jgi:hypothetical protein
MDVEDLCSVPGTAPQSRLPSDRAADVRVARAFNDGFILVEGILGGDGSPERLALVARYFGLNHPFTLTLPDRQRGTNGLRASGFRRDTTFSGTSRSLTRTLSIKRPSAWGRGDVPRIAQPTHGDEHCNAAPKIWHAADRAALLRPDECETFQPPRERLRNYYSSVA